jgi:pimeloyl-ACP methyl ester carboxylesterase
MEKVGVERYTVVGTSYGGFVAYRMGSMWPERVEKVVIASSGVNMVRKDNEEVLKRANVEKIEDVLLPKTANQLRTLVGLAVFRRSYMPDFLLNDIIDKLYCENRKEKLELLKGLTLGREDTINITPLQQEVLIIWGKNDKIFLCDKATQLKEIIGKKVRMEVIEGASHMPQIEQPARFNTILHNFLSPTN